MLKKMPTGRDVLPHQQQQQFGFKVVLLGEGNAGKSSIMAQYLDQAFHPNSQSTQQAAFRIKKSVVDGKNVKVGIWDTAGQERFHALGPIYYRDSNGAVIVYDLTDSDSFSRAKSWIEELRRMLGDRVCISIVGNKVDLAATKRAVSRDDAEALAQRVNARFFETSARTKEGIQELFDDLTKRMLDRAHSVESEQGLGRTSLRPQLMISNDEQTQHANRHRCC